MKVRELVPGEQYVVLGQVATVLEAGLPYGNNVPQNLGVRVRYSAGGETVVKAQDIQRAATERDLREESTRGKRREWRDRVLTKVNDRVGSSLLLSDGGRVVASDGDLRRVAAACGVDVGMVDRELGYEG
jgi:hypothetical protein